MSLSTGIAQEQVLGKAYDARLMRRLWQFVKPHSVLLGLALVMMPITVGFEVAQPYLIKLAIDEHIMKRSLDGLGAIALMYVFLVVFQALSSFFQLYWLQLLGQRSMHALRLKTYAHVTSQRSAFFDRMPVGRLLTRMTNDVEAINEMFASGVVTLVADFVKLAAIVVMMLVLNVQLTIMTFLTLPLLIVLINYSRLVMRSSFRTIRVKLAAMNAHVQEHLSGIKVVQLFGRQAEARRDYDEINTEYRDAYLGAIRADASMYAGVEAIGSVSVACIAWYAGGAISEGAFTVGLVVAFIEYIHKFFVPVRDLSAKYAVMQSAMAATERIFGLLDQSEPDAPVRRSFAAEAAESPASKEPSSPATAPAVEFRNVTFSYRPGEPVLRGVSFQLRRGATIAIVGATGSGKSTIVKLLTRLYEPQAGRILLEGRDIATLPAAELRRRVTCVSQDVFLFSGTVRENIELGHLGEKLGAEELAKALVSVGADRVLARRDGDASEVVAERGGNFSAGERQLIAFARALVRNPEILVLDEATAHVDPEAEAWIEKGMAVLMRGRTTLVIAHRLSTIRNADEILVLSRGRVVESGTHEALLAKGGVYAQLERIFSRRH